MVIKQQTVFLDGLNLAALCNLALAQPLFSVLSENPEFFLARKSSFSDVLSFAFLLSITLPLLFVLLRILCSFLNERAGKVVQYLSVALLVSVLMLPPLNKVASLNGSLVLIIAACSGIAAAVCYRNVAGFQKYLSFLSPAIVLVPIIFLYNGSGNFLARQQERPPAVVKISSPAPIVFVIFDEFPLVSLLDGNREIDAVRYPNFGKLQKEFTWYRNATTVSSSTERSIPAIFTGKYPASEHVSPTLKNFPDNLFTILHGRYDFRVHETITSLSPPINTPAKPSYAVRMKSILWDAAAVFLQIEVPSDFAAGLPSVSHGWTDFWEPKAASKPNEVKRDEVFLKSLSDLRTSDKPILFYCHMLLPHNPFTYMPSGKRYDWVGYGPSGLEGLQPDNVWIPDPSIANVNYQRHLLQVQYLDHLLGMMIAKLKETDLYERSLIIIASDHGISFAPGRAFREPVPGNYGDVLSIPLFIKRPHQKDGAIVDRAVQTIDILPTVASILGIELPWHTDGVSMLQGSGRGKLKAATKTGFVELTESAIGQTSSLQRKVDLFKVGSNESMFNIGPFSEYHNRRLEEFEIGKKSDLSVQLRRELPESIDLNSEVLPCFIRGIVNFSAGPERHVNLAIVVNGVLRATARSADIRAFLLKRNIEAFEAMLSESVFQNGKNSIRIFEIEERPAALPLLHQVTIERSDQ